MNKYQQAKERARQTAVDWQLTFSDNVYYWSDYLEDLFDLFVNGGIL